MPSAAVRRLSPLQWAGVGLGGCAVLLALLGLLAPASAFFFPLLSIWASVGLFVLALCVLRVAGAELDFFRKAVVFGIWAVAVVYFYWTLSSRSFVYVWDYANYLLKQYDAEAAFAQSTGAGFRFLLDSITEDYTNFIPLFTEFPFCLSGKTGDDYAFCQLFSVLPSLLVLLAGLVCKAGQLLRVKNTRWYFLIGFSWCVTFPFLRMSAMLGQPDWFGLIFAFMLLLLTLDYRFDRIDLPRYLLIFAATAGVILSQSDKQEAAWEFLKWWMSAETQTRYGRELEAILGTGARWNTANVESFFSLPWDARHAQIIKAQMESAREQMIVPGGYFTGRHIINAWNSVVVNNKDARGMLEKAVKDINKELNNKRKEFGLDN